MKLGRNAPCRCGSGKKYKQCCLGNTPNAPVMDELKQITMMNPNLSLDELNVVLEHKMAQKNAQPHPDFCGLSPDQMTRWLYGSQSEVTEMRIRTPSDLSSSPVMHYLKLILDEAIKNGGSFKATAKGNLPAKLVKQASELLPTFLVDTLGGYLDRYAFTGINEDKFTALHYTRILAELAGILYRRSGHYHVKKTAQKSYKNEGLSAFFIPMLDAATTQYNWAYLDGWDEDIDVRLFWRFMLWRVHTHGNGEQLIDEMMTAFPDLLLMLAPDDVFPIERQFKAILESRFLCSFLQYWGFVVARRGRYIEGEGERPMTLHSQPMLREAFEFTV